jgi:membrane-associated phospholipid phosphatase
MPKRDAQRPPEHTLRRPSHTRLHGGTTSADPHADGRVTDAGRATDAAESLGADPATRSADPLPPLLPHHVRRRAGITAACCAIVIAVLSVIASNRSHGNALDRPVDSWLRDNLGSHSSVLNHITYLGGGQMALLLGAVLVLACLLTRRVNGAIMVMVSVVVAAVLTEKLLKPLVHETINGFLTFPSGHTSSVFTLTVAVGVLILSPPRQRPRPWLRTLLMVCLLIISCAVALAMVAMQLHYFTDTIAGAALGTGVVLATSFLLDMPGMRRLLGTVTPNWLKPQPSA